jgi:CRP-like cAMP-binding protein
LFSQLSLADCETIVGLAHEGQYKTGKSIFFEGDSIGQVVLLTSGMVKLSQSGPQGQEVILRLVGAGETISVECFPNCKHCSTARAVERSSALVWEVRQFEAMRQRFPLLAKNVSCVLLHTLNQLEIRFREISTEKVAPRLCNQLVRLASQVGRRRNDEVEIGLSRRDLAQLTGTTLFTVSRLLGEWESMGIVRPRRQGVVLLNIAALANVARSAEEQDAENLT